MRRAVFGLLGLVVLASGCSLGPREDWAEDIRAALETARDAGGARVVQRVSIKPIETNIRQDPQPLLARSAGVADFDARRARMDGSAPRKTQVIYDDFLVYATRSKSSSAEGKPWARFDFEREPDAEIDVNDRRMAVGVGLISPVIALELLEGVLTGSIERIGTGQKAGAMTTRYTARLAPDAAVTEISDEDRQDGLRRLFDILGVQQDDFPVDVWLDDEDRVRGLRFEMRQQKDRVNAFAMNASWEFSDYGATEAIDVPPRGKWIRPDRFRDFVTELIREFG